MRSRWEIDVQEKLDAWLAGDSATNQYVTKIYYVADGEPMPADVTHVVRLSSVRDEDLDLRLGVVATVEAAALANMLLGLLDDGPRDGARPEPQG
jgi:hypothetical protein